VNRVPSENRKIVCAQRQHDGRDAYAFEDVARGSQAFLHDPHPGPSDRAELDPYGSPADPERALAAEEDLWNMKQRGANGSDGNEISMRNFSGKNPSRHGEHETLIRVRKAEARQGEMQDRRHDEQEEACENCTAGLPLSGPLVAVDVELNHSSHFSFG